MEDLITDDDLQDFPGAPFPSDVVSAVNAAIRQEAGWHIAPVLRETMTVQTRGSTTVWLPTFVIDKVHSVTDAVTGAELDGFVTLTRTGNLVFPKRKRLPLYITIDLSHGYAKCPEDLLLFAAQRAQMATIGMTRQESLGSRSISLGSTMGVETSSVVARHKLPPEA